MLLSKSVALSLTIHHGCGRKIRTSDLRVMRIMNSGPVCFNIWNVCHSHDGLSGKEFVLKTELASTGWRSQNGFPRLFRCAPYNPQSAFSSLKTVFWKMKKLSLAIIRYARFKFNRIFEQWKSSPGGELFLLKRNRRLSYDALVKCCDLFDSLLFGFGSFFCDFFVVAGSVYVLTILCQL